MIYSVPEKYGAKKRQVTCRLWLDDYAKIAKLARDSDVSVNEVVGAFLTRALRERWTVRVPKPTVTRAGPASTDQGPNAGITG
jgi:hypothetical protein